jgi:four helix bundle protein
MYDFEKFPVYILSENLYLSLRPLITSTTAPKHLREQLDRAASSIVLNIAEGAGKYSKKDKKNFYVTARGSAQETVAILRLLKLQLLISNMEYDAFYTDLVTISKMLSGLIKRMLM